MPPGAFSRFRRLGKTRNQLDIYGEMIYTHATAIDVSSLSAEQVEAVTTALYQQELPL
jgi:hypothetical protein